MTDDITKFFNTTKGDRDAPLGVTQIGWLHMRIDLYASAYKAMNAWCDTLAQRLTKLESLHPPEDEPPWLGRRERGHDRRRAKRRVKVGRRVLTTPGYRAKHHERRKAARRSGGGFSSRRKGERRHD